MARINTTKKIPVQTHVPPKVLDKIQKKANETGLSQSETIRRLVLNSLEKEANQK